MSARFTKTATTVPYNLEVIGAKEYGRRAVTAPSYRRQRRGHMFKPDACLASRAAHVEEGYTHAP